MSSSIASEPQFARVSIVELYTCHGCCLSAKQKTMPPWSLISPASRGIGFALARRVLQATHTPVIATARKDLDKTREELLKDLKVDEGRLTVLKLDVLGRW